MLKVCLSLIGVVLLTYSPIYAASIYTCDLEYGKHSSFVIYKDTTGHFQDAFPPKFDIDNILSLQKVDNVVSTGLIHILASNKIFDTTTTIADHYAVRIEMPMPHGKYFQGYAALNSDCVRINDNDEKILKCKLDRAVPYMGPKGYTFDGVFGVTIKYLELENKDYAVQHVTFYRYGTYEGRSFNDFALLGDGSDTTNFVNTKCTIHEGWY